MVSEIEPSKVQSVRKSVDGLLDVQVILVEGGQTGNQQVRRSHFQVDDWLADIERVNNCI